MSGIELIDNLIKEYDKHGNHRTGTKIDNISGEWILNKLEELGLEPVKFWFKFNTVRIRKAFINLHNKEVYGFPLFDRLNSKSI